MILQIQYKHCINCFIFSLLRRKIKINSSVFTEKYILVDLYLDLRANYIKMGIILFCNLFLVHNREMKLSPNLELRPIPVFYILLCFLRIPLSNLGVLIMIYRYYYGKNMFEKQLNVMCKVYFN